MTADPILLAQLRRDEACELTAYPDPESPLGQWLAADRRRWDAPGLWPVISGAPWTIGYGHTGPEVHRGLEWTPGQAEAVLEVDAARACAQVAHAWPWSAGLDAPRRRVLENMCFNLGAARLAGFRHFLAFMEAGEFDEAAGRLSAADEEFDEAAPAGLASLWARQTSSRAQRLMQTVRTGIDG